MEKELAEIFRNVAPTATQKRRAVELAMNNPLQKSLDFIFQAARLAHSYMRPESEPSMSIRDDTVSLAGDDEPIGIVEQSSAEIPEQPASSATTTTAKRPDSGRKRKAELPLPYPESSNSRSPAVQSAFDPPRIRASTGSSLSASQIARLDREEEALEPVSAKQLEAVNRYPLPDTNICFVCKALLNLACPRNVAQHVWKIHRPKWSNSMGARYEIRTARKFGNKYEG